MENRAHAIAAGIFVLAITALLIGLAVWLMRDTGERRIYELSSAEGVTGLQPQAHVRYKGVPVGRVVAIELDPVVTGHVLLRIAVDATTPITTTTFASLTFQGVTGLGFIQLDDVPGARTPLATSTEQPARIPLRPGLMARLTDQGSNLLAQVEAITLRVNQLLGPDKQQHVMQSVAHIGQAAAAIAQLAQRSEQLLGVQVAALAHEGTTTLQGVQAVLAGLKTTSEALAHSAQDMRQISARMAAPGGTLDAIGHSTDALLATNRALHAGLVPRLNRSADAAAHTLRQTDNVMDTLRHNPQAWLLGAGPVVPGPGEAGFSAPEAR